MPTLLWSSLNIVTQLMRALSDMLINCRDVSSSYPFMFFSLCTPGKKLTGFIASYYCTVSIILLVVLFLQRFHVLIHHLAYEY